MATTYKIKRTKAHQTSIEPIKYATNIWYQVSDAVTTTASKMNIVLGRMTDQTYIVRTPQGDVQHTHLITNDREATDSEIRSHLDSLVGV